MSHEVIASVRPHRRKANVLNLNACICGLTITEREIEDNNGGYEVPSARVRNCVGE